MPRNVSHPPPAAQETKETPVKTAVSLTIRDCVRWHQHQYNLYMDHTATHQGTKWEKIHREQADIHLQFVKALCYVVPADVMKELQTQMDDLRKHK